MTSSVRTVVTSCLRIETEAVTMDSLEAIQLPTSRTFWNSHDPSLDPFDETLVPAMASDPLEACSSTFQQLFTSTDSTGDESDDHQAIFKVNTPSDQQTNIFVDNLNVEGEAEESSLATAQSYCTNAHDGGGMNTTESSLFTWSLPSPPTHYHPQDGEFGAGDSQGMGHFDGGLDPNIFGPLSSSALELGHGSENQVPFLKEPLMRQSSFRQPGGKERRTKASWQSIPANISIDQSRRNIFLHQDQPLGSPCSVISGFTKALQGGEHFGSDYNMATSFGPSSSHAVHAQEGKESPSGTHQQADGGVLHRVAPKRKRSKTPRLTNGVESQRMTHIAVERNRRKQMNEHLAALRALMPGSYVQKGDQASIVGGAIEFVKELEHLLVCLQSQKRRRAYSDLTSPRTPTSRLAMPNPDPQHNQIAQATFSFHSPQSPFAVGATASTEIQLGNIGRALQAQPQISYPGAAPQVSTSTMVPVTVPGMNDQAPLAIGEAKSDVASVEVQMMGMERALVKVMAVRRSGQLLRTVVALESLALTVLHANITTVNHTVLYSFQTLIGPLCRLNPHEIAAALHQTFSSLHSLQF
ncbi:hypothetical protein M758_11G052200 [Ceratodon purpureus]|nr:hypothetical protein M758_11G052200 [Ceratodon purpureus]